MLFYNTYIFYDVNAMILFALKTLIFLMSQSIVSKAETTAETSCLHRQISLNLTYTRLVTGCRTFPNSTAVKNSAGFFSVSLQPAESDYWPPPGEALTAEARLALVALRPYQDRLSYLSLGGLPLGSHLPELLQELLELRELTGLNISDIGITNLPVELLKLPRLTRIEAASNPLNCGGIKNRWAELLSALDSDLLRLAPPLHCNETSLGNITMEDDSGTGAVDIDPEPTLREVDLHGSLRLPCSERYFRLGDAGLWSPDTRVTWRRFAGEEVIFRLAVGNGSSSPGSVVSYVPTVPGVTSHLAVGCFAEGAPLLISGLRQAVVGDWRCELAKGDSSGGARVSVRHFVTLRPPLTTIEKNCYIVAVATSIGMIFIGLLAAFLRGMVRNRCCTRKVHIVEAQSVLHLDASPQLFRRQIEAAPLNTGVERPLLDEPPIMDATRIPIVVGDSALVVASEDLLTASSYIGAAGLAGQAGWRDRLREINDQMKQHANRLGESMGSTMRAGWTSGMEHMKEQMRSMAEFCGTNTPLGQTVSVVSVYTDPEGRQEPLEQHLHLLSSV